MAKDTKIKMIPLKLDDITRRHIEHHKYMQKSLESLCLMTALPSHLIGPKDN